MNILEWALNGKKMEDYFERIRGGWHFDSNYRDGWVQNLVLKTVILHFKEKLGLER